MYAVQLEYALVEAYEHVHKCTGIRKRCQKQFYNRKVHGLAPKMGTKVWAQQSAVPRGSSKSYTTPRLVPRLSSPVHDTYMYLYFGGIFGIEQMPGCI